MADSNNNKEFANIQATIDKMRLSGHLSAKAQRRLADLESSLLTGVMPLEQASKALAGLDDEPTNSVRMIERPPMITGSQRVRPNNTITPNRMRITPAVTNIGTNINSLLAKIDSMLVELLLESNLSTLKKLAVYVLSDIRYSLSDLLKLHGNNEILQELLSDQLPEYEKIIDALKDTSKYKETVLNQALEIIKRNQNVLNIKDISMIDEYTEDNIEKYAVLYLKTIKTILSDLKTDSFSPFLFRLLSECE